MLSSMLEFGVSNQLGFQRPYRFTACTYFSVNLCMTDPGSPPPFVLNLLGWPEMDLPFKCYFCEPFFYKLNFKLLCW